MQQKTPKRYHRYLGATVYSYQPGLPNQYLGRCKARNKRSAWIECLFVSKCGQYSQLKTIKFNLVHDDWWVFLDDSDTEQHYYLEFELDPLMRFISARKD